MVARNLAGLRRYRKLLIAVVALCVIVYQATHQSSDTAPPGQAGEGPHRVQRVVDGDTLLLEDRTRVRLIGVNTPEMTTNHGGPEPWAVEATKFTESFVEGKDVHLQFDRERLDQYKRTLAYVRVGDAMLNEELVRAGLARVPNRYRYSASTRRRFEQIRDEARAAKRGIWSDGGR